MPFPYDPANTKQHGTEPARTEVPNFLAARSSLEGANERGLRGLKEFSTTNHTTLD